MAKATRYRRASSTPAGNTAGKDIEMQRPGDKQGSERWSSEAESDFILKNFHKIAQEDPNKKTDAYGRIVFPGSDEVYYPNPCEKDEEFFRSKYVRVSPHDNKDKLVELMTKGKYWDLSKPVLIISIQGGAGRFKCANKLINSVFMKGLVDVAVRAGTWILTSGTNTGIDKEIGCAVKNHMKLHGLEMSDDNALIGISSWKCLANTAALANKNSSEFDSQKFTVKIPSNSPTGLDPNHSHYILVDSETTDDCSRNIEKIVEWRGNFETIISKANDEAKIPVVTLLVNGGKRSLRSCARGLALKVPIVAVAGSGRAADVVVRIKESPKGNSTTVEDHVRQIYTDVMKEEPNMETLKSLKEFYDNHECIFTFKLKPRRTVPDMELDYVILSAVEKCQGVEAKLKLALYWKLIDYAREKILNREDPNCSQLGGKKKFQDMLQELAVEALIRDVPEFFELFVDHGLELERFVEPKNLEKLYKKSMNGCDGPTRFAEHLFKSQSCRKKPGCKCTKESYCIKCIEEVFKSLLNNTYSEGTKKGYPYLKLYLWAILFNRIDTAERLFIRSKGDPLMTSVVGCLLLRSLKRKCERQYGKLHNLTLRYKENQNLVEKWAYDILDWSWNDKHYDCDVLTKKSEVWDNSDVLATAYDAKMENLLEHQACYRKLKRMWRQDISLTTHWLWVIIAAVMWPFPFSVFFLDFADEIGKVKLTRHQKPKGKREIWFLEAWWKLARTPVMLCIHLTMFNISFLVVFSLYMLHELRPLVYGETEANSTLAEGTTSNITDSIALLAEGIISNIADDINKTCLTCIPGSIGKLEIVTYIFVFIILLEEFRQIKVRCWKRRGTVRFRLKQYIEFWNIIDVICFLLFAVGTALRFSIPQHHFKIARLFLSLSLASFIIRFCQIFLMARRLSPKITMIKKMVVDLLMFVFILMMMNCIFGIITRSVLDPELPFELHFSKIFFLSYFLMYGELFLSEFDGYWRFLPVIYLLLTTLLLLNLLIAMFNYQFQKAQDRADRLYKYNFYALVVEHYDRTPPLLFGTVYELFFSKCSCNWRNFNCCCGEKPARPAFIGTPYPNVNADDGGDRDFKNYRMLCVQRGKEKWVNQLPGLSGDEATTRRHADNSLDRLDEIRDLPNSRSIGSNLGDVPDSAAPVSCRCDCEAEIKDIKKEMTNLTTSWNQLEKKLNTLLAQMPKSDNVLTSAGVDAN